MHSTDLPKINIECFVSHTKKRLQPFEILDWNSEERFVFLKDT